MHSAQRRSIRDQLRAWRLLDLPFASVPGTAFGLREYFYPGPSQRRFLPWVEETLRQGIAHAVVDGAPGSGRSTLLRLLQATNGVNGTPLLAVQHSEFTSALEAVPLRRTGQAPVADVPLIVMVDDDDAREVPESRDRLARLASQGRPVLLMTTGDDPPLSEPSRCRFQVQKLTTQQWQDCLRLAFRFAGREDLPMSDAVVRWLVRMHDARWNTLVPHLQRTLLVRHPGADGTLSDRDFIVTKGESELDFKRAA
ncbi:MAG: hypothetical protein AAGD07_07535 [Planctomycetota bacterium]